MALLKNCVISSLTFFSDKILTIRHQLDTLPDAPDFAILDDAIIASAFSQFSPTSEEELSGIVKKSQPNLVLLTPYLLLFCANLLMIYYLLFSKRTVNLSLDTASIAFNAKFHEEGSIFSSTEETVS